MKQADVTIGDTYLTYVGQALVPVTVRKRDPGQPKVTHGGKVINTPDMFTVRRVGAGKDLPKRRSAAALRPAPQPTEEPAKPRRMPIPVGGGSSGWRPNKPATQCEPIESENILPGWGCCQCRAYNGNQRTACKMCGHACCCSLPTSNLEAECPFCHETGGHTAECYRLQHEPYEDKVAKHLDPAEPIIGAIPISSLEDLDALADTAGDFLDPVVPAKSTPTLCEGCGIELAKDHSTVCGLPLCPTCKQYDEQETHPNCQPEPSPLPNEYEPEDAARWHREHSPPPTERTPNVPPPEKPISAIVVTQAEYDMACENRAGWCTVCLGFARANTPSSNICFTCPVCDRASVYAPEYALDAGYITIEGQP